MSDIYLQITETPTVVTLSAPVVSGALAATVTVGNTVTVALDSNSLSALENVTVTVGAAITGTVTVANFPATQPISGTVTIGNTVTIAGTVTANPTGTQTIAGTVTAMAGTNFADEVYNGIFNFSENNQMGVYVTDPLPTGTNRIGVVTIGAGTVTIGAGTAQIGSVTASISNSVVTFYPMQGTTVTNSNFTSTTASTTLVSAVARREVLTVFNEGAGNLHISPGATCTTVAYQVRLSAGDYWECPAGQLSLAHTAVFATAGTARVTEVS